MRAILVSLFLLTAAALSAPPMQAHVHEEGNGIKFVMRDEGNGI